MYALAEPIAPPVLPSLPLDTDLFGRILADHHAGRPGDFYQRRDDNHVDRDHSERYFRTPAQLPPHQQCLLLHAAGRVLDFGAGAGQHALALQARGLAVTAIDSSPLAIDVCRRRGVRDARVADGLALHGTPGSFDTVLMLGNSLGIAGTPDGLRALFTRLHRLVAPGGQMLAEIIDYTATYEPLHLRYHTWNRSRGRYPGALGLRLEYAGHRGPTFDWLLISFTDLRQIAAQTGWKVARCVQVMAEATHAIGLVRV